MASRMQAPDTPGSPQLAPVTRERVRPTGEIPRADGLPLGAGDRRIHVDRARQPLAAPWRGQGAQRLIGLGLFSGDLIVATGLLFLLPFVRFEPPQNPFVGAVLIAAIALGTFVAGGYRFDALRRSVRLVPVGALVCMAGAWVVLKFMATKAGQGALTPPGAIGLLGFAAFLTAWLLVSRGLVARALRRMEGEAKLLFIGAPSAGARLMGRLREQGLANPVIVFDPEGGASADPERAAHPIAALPQHLTGAVRAIVLAHPAEALARGTLDELVHCRVRNVPVLSPAQLIEETLARVPVLADDPTWFLHDAQLYGGRSVVYAGVKRIIDILGALVGLVLASPVLLVAGIAIKLSSRGPIIYRQVRTGQWGRDLTMLKLRTMGVDAEREGIRWAERNDPRATSVGRWLRRTHVDELPQLWNVLRGNMSLVGPRPERPELNEELRTLIPYYDMRHLVKPGITGWAQVRHAYGASVDDAIAKLEHDIYYVKHASLAFDLRIVWLTAGRVLGLRGR